MIRRMVLLVMAAAALTAAWACPTVAQSSDGIIQGVVKNGTQGATENSTAGLDVRLVTYDGNGSVIDWATSVTEAGGSFRFTGVATDPAYQHLVTAKYLGVEYSSDPVVFAEGDTGPKEADLSIYETTTVDEFIVVVNSHMMMYAQENPVRVVEQYAFFNEGDRTYVGSTGNGAGVSPTLLFSLPDGAEDVQLDMGLVHPVNTEDGFADTAPVTPGSRMVGFTYYLSRSATLEFSRTINYKTSQLAVAATGKRIGLTSPQLELQDPLQIPDKEGNVREWLFMAGVNLPRGTELEVGISWPAKSDNTLFWIIGALVAVALAAVVAYLLVRRRQLQPATAKAPRVGRDGAGDKERRRDSLLRQIAQLDDDFEDGAISREAYDRARASKKAELLKVMRQTGNGEDGGKKGV